jgi:hypothetical protein
MYYSALLLLYQVVKVKFIVKIKKACFVNPLQTNVLAIIISIVTPVWHWNV